MSTEIHKIKDARAALDELLVKCKADIKKAHRIEGVIMIVNDYHIWAQKYLLVLDLPVTYILDQTKTAVSIASKSSSDA